MLWVLAILALIWGGLGWAFDMPPRARLWFLTGIVLAAVLAIHATLPANNPLVVAIGGTLGGWLVVIGFVALCALYGRGVAWLKARAPEAPPKAEEGPFTDTELNRYARHIVLREVGGPGGQLAMKHAKVLVVGAGGGWARPRSCIWPPPGSAPSAWWMMTRSTIRTCNARSSTVIRTSAHPRCSLPNAR